MDLGSMVEGMSPGAKIIVLLIVVLGGLVKVWLNNQTRKIDAAAAAARDAAAKAAPTGDGFADKVKADLETLVIGQAEIKEQIADLRVADATTEGRINVLEAHCGKARKANG